MQVTSVEKRSNEWMGTAVSVLLIGMAIVAFGAVISQMGLLNGLMGGETATSASLSTAVSGDITLSAQEMRFGQEEIYLKVGETVTILLDNNDLYAHSFDTDDLDVHVAMPANGQVMATFTATEPGEFEFYCNVPGHQQAGMVGKLIVEP
jgi:uncharacterized cupredoxin-like copper-binding protein